MKSIVKFAGLRALCVGLITAASFVPGFQEKAQAATTFSPLGGYVVYSGNGSIYGTNSGGLYPTSLAGNAGAASYVYAVSATKPFAIEVQGQTVSGTSTMVVGLWQVASPVSLALNPNTGAITNSSTTPLQFVGWLTNACTASPSCTVFTVGPNSATPTGSSGALQAAGQYYYVGAITNWGSGVLTNYAVSVVGGN